MNEMRKLIEAIEKIEEDVVHDMSDESFGEFVDHLKGLSNTHERANALYLWTIAEKGLSQTDFRDLVKLIEALGRE